MEGAKSVVQNEGERGGETRGKERRGGKEGEEGRRGAEERREKSGAAGKHVRQF